MKLLTRLKAFSEPGVKGGNARAGIGFPGNRESLESGCSPVTVGNLGFERELKSLSLEKWGTAEIDLASSNPSGVASPGMLCSRMLAGRSNP